MSEAESEFRWVLLRHDVPSGDAREGSGGQGANWHYDWMIEEEGNERLVCFRVMVRVDELGQGARFEGERLADHRREYLEYEGEISGGRGRVTRVAEGVCGGWRGGDGGSVVMGAVKVVGRVKSGAVWEFEVG